MLLLRHPKRIKRIIRPTKPHTTPITVALLRSNHDGENGPSLSPKGFELLPPMHRPLSHSPLPPRQGVPSKKFCDVVMHVGPFEGSTHDN